MLSVVPRMVPSNVIEGRSGSAGFGGDRTATGATEVGVAGGGGRRESEKIGRSRVINNCLSGSAQSGFPADGGRSTAASGDRAAVRRGAASPELTARSDGGAVAELTGRSGGAVVCAIAI